MNLGNDEYQVTIPNNIANAITPIHPILKETHWPFNFSLRVSDRFTYAWTFSFPVSSPYSAEHDTFVIIDPSDVQLNCVNYLRYAQTCTLSLPQFVHNFKFKKVLKNAK